MSLRHLVSRVLFRMGVVVWLAAATSAWASVYRGLVTFNGLPLPGSVVTVTATQGAKKVTAITDLDGGFVFPDLADGQWSIDIEMTGFAPVKQEITVAANAPVATFAMKLLTLAQIQSADKPVVEAAIPAAPAPAAPVPEAKAEAGKGAKAKAAPAAGAPAAPEPAPAQDAAAQQANDGFLINGSVNNAATSQFSLNQAFGNNRNGGRSLYNYSARLTLDSSALDAQQYSLSGEPSIKPAYNNLTGGVSFGGPLKIPHLLTLARAPNIYLDYQRTQNSTVTIADGLVPTAAELGGNLSAAPNVTAIYAPATGLSAACLSTPGVTPGAPFAGNVIPTACLSSVSQALAKFYPAPNVTGTSLYNYQIPLATDLHQDSYRGQVQKALNNKNYVYGYFIVSDARQSTPSLFGFVDTNDTLNTAAQANWNHRITQRLSMNVGYQFSRSRSLTTPYFANRTNVSLASGITGNLQDPSDWGPPSLGFGTSGTYGLSDANSASVRPETNGLSYNVQWNRFRHNMQFGGDFRRQEFNNLRQSNPRGSLGFTGLATESSAGAGGSDLADFLLGIPDTSQIAYGNADKYLRQSVYDLYANDDFRVSPELSVNFGVRWEYGAPATELKNRLVNLDIEPGFVAEQAVVATGPTGPLTGQRYPTSLVRPDYSFPEPQVGIAWRPISGSSLLVRAGYGIRNDTSNYQNIALAMAQQAPLSTSLSVPNTASCRFTIAAPFAALPCASTVPDAFAIDPNFKVGYVQQWQLQVQRDLPFSLQMVATYTGIKGTRGVQEILPNSYPVGLTASPYGAAPSGYFYRDSDGNSTREAGQMQLRRRLRNGFTANVTYTFSKSLDDDYSLGGQGQVATSGSPQVAQDWTNPRGQRGLSTFDQRNVLNGTLQYTTGMGLGGRTMLSGWRGAVYKEWTVLATVSAASGLPETPIDPVVVPGTGQSDVIRANYVGGAIHQVSPGGLFLNQAAFVAPAAGQWGTARRDSITGPSQFTLNGSMNRAFRIHDRYNLTAEINAANVLNHVTYAGWNTTLGTLFGEATTANSMRSVTVVFRLRY